MPDMLRSMRNVCASVRNFVAFSFLAAIVLPAAADLAVPATPKTAAEARVLLSNLETLQDRERYKIDLQERACYDKTLISMCLSEVRSQRSKMTRSFRQVENHARDLVRMDDVEARRKTREAEALKAIEEAPAKEQEQKKNVENYEKRQREAADRSPATPRVRLRNPAAAGDSGPTPQEQVANRLAYEQKLKEAEERKRTNDERLQELEKKRAKIRAEQTQP
jgi:colicin import membrane protein